MRLEELLARVERISPDRGYWFIRTDSGSNFETFVQNNFIGIGWNEITENDLANKSIGEIKEKIASIEKLDLEIAKGKAQATAIYTKISRFSRLKKGDFILIPSYGSSRLAFGEIADSKVYSDAQIVGNCDYVKRRKVKWLEVKHLDDLDPVFFQIKHPRHAIFDVKEYQPYLDRVTETLYKRNDFVHYVLDIRTRKDIDLDLLLQLMESIKKLTKAINDEFKLDEDQEQLTVKLNLQSPGKLELIRKAGGTLILLAIVLSSCTTGEATGNRKLDDFINVNQPTINKIDTTIKKLEIDKDKITKL